MSFKFILGFGTGLYIGTFYNCRPYIEQGELMMKQKMIEFKEFLEKNKRTDNINDESSNENKNRKKTGS